MYFTLYRKADESALDAARQELEDLMVAEEQFHQDDVELSLKRTEKLLQVRRQF